MSFFEKHQVVIDKAIAAVAERTFYAQYPEHPKFYGKEVAERGQQNFEQLLGKPFELPLQGNGSGRVGQEKSPYTGEALGIDYPKYEVNELIGNAQAAMKSWKKTSPQERAGILVETIESMKEVFHEIAHATMHTTGQAYMMSFQASGPHAADRALEALVLAYQEVSRFPESAVWEKPMGKVTEVVRKTWKPVPKGVSLAVGVSTFPIWNMVPGIYASLMTGNPVVVKPHPLSILPMAILIKEMQKVFEAAGLSPHLIQLAADNADEPITKTLAEHDATKVIDFTGGNAFGDYIESLEAKGKTTFTEKAGVNTVILDSVTDFKGVAQNLSMSMCLYSGQMCTAPQNIFIPEDGIETADGKMSFDEVCQNLKKAVTGLVSHPKAGPGVLGAIQSEATYQRGLDAKAKGAEVLLEPIEVNNPEFPKARILSPTILVANAEQVDLFGEECFGPVVFLIKTKNTQESIDIAQKMAAEHGAITCGAYATDEELQNNIAEAMEATFTPVTFNYSGNMLLMNQNAAFSDFHVTGGNAAGNASLSNPEFVIKRFVWVGHKFK